MLDLDGLIENRVLWLLTARVMEVPIHLANIASNLKDKNRQRRKKQPLDFSVKVSQFYLVCYKILSFLHFLRLR